MKRPMTGKSARERGNNNGVEPIDESTLAGIPPEWRKYYVKLLAIRERVMRERNHEIQDVEEPLPRRNNNLADLATDESDHEVAIAKLAAEENALYEVNEAIRRIENGTYGVCEATGKRISGARLSAVPWTRFSRSAEAQLERETRPHD